MRDGRIPRSSNRFVNACGKESITRCRDAGARVARICFPSTRGKQGERHDYDHDQANRIRRRRRHHRARIAEGADRGVRLAGRDVRVGEGVSRSSATSDAELPGAGRGLCPTSAVWIFRSASPAIGPDMPVIFITGCGDVSMSVQAMKAGAIEFLTKPFRNDVLMDAIRQALGAQPPRAGARRDTGRRFTRATRR